MLQHSAIMSVAKAARPWLTVRISLLALALQALAIAVGPEPNLGREEQSASSTQAVPWQRAVAICRRCTDSRPRCQIRTPSCRMRGTRPLSSMDTQSGVFGTAHSAVPSVLVRLTFPIPRVTLK